MSSLLARLALCLLFASANSFAAPYPSDGLPTQWTQPDGTPLKLRVFGDEFYARTTTEEGYTVVFDPQKSAYYYAEPSGTGKDLKKSKTPAHAKPPAKLQKHLTESADAVAKILKSNIEKYIPDREQKWNERVKAAQARRKAEKDGEVQPAAPESAPALTGSPVTGEIIGLTILVRFPDVPFPTTQARIVDFCNKVGYSGDGNSGSVRDYFYDQSLSKLTYTQSVTQIVMLPNPRGYYNWSDYPANTSLRYPAEAAHLIIQDAVVYLQSQGFSFSNLTLNSNSYVIATNVIFSGPDSGKWLEGLWPHRSSFGDGIFPVISLVTSFIKDYQITNIENSAPGIGTFVHENGHLVCGFPDLYDMDEEPRKSAGLGMHCLMAAGNLNDKTPSPINIYLKDTIGWATLTNITPENRKLATLPGTENRGYRIFKPGNNSEYFIIENRSSSDKWAAACPDHGIAIWHIDESVDRASANNREQMTTSQHYMVSLEQADGNYDLENANLAILAPPPNLGDSGDLFDPSDGIFNSFTGPNSHWWDGTVSNIIVEVLSPASASMSVRFGPDFGIAPTDGLVSSGQAGGPFSPASKTYNFTGDSTVCFISMSASWIDVRNSSGSIMDPATPLFVDPGVNTTFTVSINSNANSLTPGTHTATITIEGPGDPLTISVTLTVEPPNTFVSVPVVVPTDIAVRTIMVTDEPWRQTQNEGGGISVYNNGSTNLQNTYIYFDLSAYAGLTVSSDAVMEIVAINHMGMTWMTDAMIGVANAPWTLRGITYDNQPGSTPIPGAINPPTGTYNEGVTVSWTIPKSVIQGWIDNGYNGLCISAGAGSNLHFHDWGDGHPPKLRFEVGVIGDNTSLVVSPADPFATSGTVGGPFTPSSGTYSLSNEGGSSVPWNVSGNPSWLDLSPTGGVIPANSSTSLIVSINSSANGLPIGTHTATITITGPDDPFTIPVTLTVNPHIGFTWQANIWQNGNGQYEGTAVLTGYAGNGGSISIPGSVTDSITITNPTTGLPELKWVSCRVTGFSNFELNSNAQFNGEVNVIGGFDLKGHTLSVQGDLIHQSGNLTLGGGRLEITGAYLQQRDSNGDGTYESCCSGRLFMNAAADFMRVGGASQFWFWNGDSVILTAGTMELKGEFYQKSLAGYGTNGFPPTGDHRVLLSGDGTQTVRFDDPGSNGFNILEVTNPSGAVIATNMRFTSLLASGVTIHFPDTGGIAGGTLGTDTKFAGNVRINGSLDLSGHKLEVDGSVISSAGYIPFGGGQLEIAGDFNGSLGMRSTADYLLVAGNAVFTGGSYSAGTAEVRGSFTAGPAGYQAGGTHRTLLSGTGTQTVTFDSPTSSFFKTLEVIHPLADTSTVSITSGGILKLDYPGTDVVGALYLGGTKQADGLYDSSNTGGLITGTGKLQVGPFANYAAWVAANAPGQSTDQDHDNDGVPNGIEYFMGKSGNDFTANPGIVDGTVTWPKSPAFNGSYAVQTSADLVEWTDVTEDAAQVTKNTDSVIWRRPTGAETRFVRLLVTPN